jgi:hypothetical protein
LQLQVLDDHARIVQDIALFGPTHRLDLLDQVLEIKGLEPPLAQQLGLSLGPDVEVLVVQSPGFGSDLGRHSDSPRDAEFTTCKISWRLSGCRTLKP